jgi:hypothetical protein
MMRFGLGKMVASLALMGVTVVGLSGCEKTLQAPNRRGVCYHIGYPASGKPQFNILAENVPSLEHCAVHLYNRRTEFIITGTAGKVTEGAYQGNFLYTDDHIVRFGQRYRGASFPLLVKAPDGRLVAPGTVVQEVARERPQPVELPDNLPQKPSEN